MEHITVASSEVSRETFGKIEQLIEQNKKPLSQYLEQLLWWNKRVNLVSRDVPRETVWNHIRHSLLIHTLSPYREAEVVLDTGTGGGLPGLPLAITSPEKHILLNDIVTKKCLAMKQMAQKLGLSNVGILDGSIEQVDHDSPLLLITKHAFKINDLLRMTEHLPWTEMVFYKGSDFEEELSGVEQPLHIRRFDLSRGGEFYTDKALLVVTKA